MKSLRYRSMKSWRKEKAEEVANERRAFLDTQRQHFLMDKRLTVFKLDNMTDCASLVEKTEGETTAKMFRKEKYEYNHVMKLHEDRFDFRQLQITYKDARTELICMTYHEMDRKMKKVRPDWTGYHELFEQTMTDARSIQSKDAEIARLNKQIIELNRRNDVLEKAVTDAYTEGVSFTQKVDNTATNKKKKRKKDV